MSEEYGPNFVTLTDEEGNDIELEYIDALEHNGTTYMAFFPVVEEGEEENEDEYGLIILKSETVDGEEMLANVVDEDEINEVYDLFMEQMMEDGIRTKLASIGEESRQKLQETMKRIVNESRGRLICIIL